MNILQKCYLQKRLPHSLLLSFWWCCLHLIVHIFVLLFCRINQFIKNQIGEVLLFSPYLTSTRGQTDCFGRGSQCEMQTSRVKAEKRDLSSEVWTKRGRENEERVEDTEQEEPLAFLTFFSWMYFQGGRRRFPSTYTTRNFPRYVMFMEGCSAPSDLSLCDPCRLSPFMYRKSL